MKKCPLMFVGKIPDPAIAYACIGSNCAWWEGEACSTHAIAHYVRGILGSKKQEKTSEQKST